MENWKPNVPAISEEKVVPSITFPCEFFYLLLDDVKLFAEMLD